ncbi:circularly permutated Ras protein 1-like [Rhinophrynus dorsalis]
MAALVMYIHTQGISLNPYSDDFLMPDGIQREQEENPSPDSVPYDNFSAKQQSQTNAGVRNPQVVPAFRTELQTKTDINQRRSSHSIPEESSMYLDVLMANPPDLEARKTPPPVPDRKRKPTLVPSPGMPGESRLYLDVLPATPMELEKQKTPPPVPKRLSRLLPPVVLDTGRNPCDNFKPKEEFLTKDQTMDMPGESRLYLDVLPATPMELKKQKTPPPVPKRLSRLLPPDPPVEEQATANCNILLLNIGKMLDVSDTLNSEKPSLCTRCSSALSRFNPVMENKSWSCVFCGTENPMEDCKTYEHIEDQLYLSNPLHEQHMYDESMLIFCVDISGSMSVTTEALKCSLLHSLHSLHEQHPMKRVALITFSDQVKLYGDGTLQPQILDDTELLDPDYLKLQGENQPLPLTLEETLNDLESKIECLEEGGSTALGPAALVSIAMASQRPGSKVIICTDGKANTDLGNLEDITEEFAYQSSRLYYSNLANMALQHSVVVSVLTIEGTDCRLPELGQLADKTGGKVNIVHPLKLASEFQSILEEEINATDVKVKVFLPHYMYFMYETHTESVLNRTIGSTTPDTVLSMEFGIHSSKIQEMLRHSQLPIQVQVTFSLLDGRRGHRILTQKRPVTNDRFTALESLTLSVLQIHSAQISAQLAMEGRVDEASKVALALKHLIEQVMKHEKYEDSGEVYEEWENSMAPIYEDLQVYVQRNSIKKNNEEGAPVVQSFTDEMAKMMFHLKQTKNRVLRKLKHQAE